MQSLKEVQTIKIHFDEIVFVSEKLKHRKAQKGDLVTCMGDWEIDQGILCTYSAHIYDVLWLSLSIIW